MNIPVFDAHCDTIFKAWQQGASLRNNSFHLDLQRCSKFTPYAQIFAVFVRPWEGKPENYDRDWPPEAVRSYGTELLTYLVLQLKQNPDMLTVCRSAQDAGNAAENGKIAAFIAVEGAELIGCELDMLATAYRQGVRFVNLCWNYDNALCGAANGPTKSGLTWRGKDYVKYMQQIGMAVDLSHASERTFWDTAEIATRPIIAGHSNSKRICDNPRNLTDDQFRELVRLGGVAGLNLCPEFLNSSGRATIDDVIRHAYHFLELGGEKSLCLGGDLDGIDDLPEGVKGIESYGEIYEAMLRQNWSEELVRDIFYNNIFNVLEKVL